MSRRSERSHDQPKERVQILSFFYFYGRNVTDLKLSSALETSRRPWWVNNRLLWLFGDPLVAINVFWIELCGQLSF